MKISPFLSQQLPMEDDDEDGEKFCYHCQMPFKLKVPYHSKSTHKIICLETNFKWLPPCPDGLKWYINSLLPTVGCCKSCFKNNWLKYCMFSIYPGVNCTLSIKELHFKFNYFNCIADDDFLSTPEKLIFLAVVQVYQNSKI